jgi:selenocysteine lyase/cysteine desulfurase
VERRTFLKGLSAGLGTLPLLPEQIQGLEGRLRHLATSSLQAVDWKEVRAEFQMNPGLVHLNCGSLGATPRLVIDAVAAYTRQVEGDPAPRTFSWGGEQMETVRARAAEFIGADLEEVAITRNTTEGMNAVASGLDLEPGDQVLTTNHEHGGGMVCWQHLRRHRGIEMVYLPMPRTVESSQQIADLVTAHLTPRTRVCSFSHVDTIMGVRMPLAEIAAITRPRDIVLVCDGAQAPGMLDVDVRSLGVDTYAFSGHRWMLRPKRSGLLYVRREVQHRVHPVLLHSASGAYTAPGGTRNVAWEQRRDRGPPEGRASDRSEDGPVDLRLLRGRGPPPRELQRHSLFYPHLQ